MMQSPNTITRKSIVKPLSGFDDVTIPLSSLDQQAQRYYASVALLFRLEERDEANVSLLHLQEGLGAALSEIPDFASTVVSAPGSSRKELQLELGSESGVPWTVVDHPSSSHWTYGNYNDLAARHLPLHDIPTTLLVDSLCIDIPEGTEDVPALLIQANLIEGGLIPVVSFYHPVADGRSVSTLLTSWARHTKACSSGCAPEPRILDGDAPERWLLSHGPSNASMGDFPEYTIDPAKRLPIHSRSFRFQDSHDLDTIASPVNIWYFSQDSLRSLCADLGASADNGAGFTDVEAVSALLWKHITRSRLKANNSDGNAEGRSSLFATRLDYRARLNPPLPGDYISYVVEPNACARVPVSELSSPSDDAAALARLASAIRGSTQSVSGESVRKFIGVINQLDAVTDLAWGYELFAGLDFAMSDSSGLEIRRTIGWGPGLDTAECLLMVTRERGLIYFLPADKTGGFEVEFQCEAEAVERLMMDEVFTRYAEFRC